MDDLLRVRVLQEDSRLADIAQPLPRIPVEAPPQELTHRRRRNIGQPPVVHIGRQDRNHHLREAVARERTSPGQQLVEDGPERPDVRAPIQHLSLRLLRAHVGGRAQDHARFRTQHGTGDDSRILMTVRFTQDFGEAEVEHLHLVVGGELHVGWLQIPVNDAAVMRGLQGLRDLPSDAERLGNRDPAARNEVREGRPFNELEDEGDARGALLNAVDRRDMRVIQGREQLRLPFEACEAVTRPRPLPRDDFQRDVAAQREIARAPHIPHTAAAEQRDDLVRPDPCTYGQGHE